MIRRWAWVGALLLAGCGLEWSEFSDATDLTDVSDETDVPLDCPLDACFGECTDLDSDPENCGDCGRTCIIFRGTPTCDAGECVLDVCDAGYADCDGDVNNGCEEAVTCEEAAPCDTTCGSTGSISCADACEPVCLEPTEQCNALDDDCDGGCDEGALPGCRHSVYRSHGPLGHVYGNDTAEAARLGQTVERAQYFFLYAEATTELRPLYRCDKGGGRRFLTTSTNCEIGRAPEATLGFIASRPICGSTPLYRLYSATASNHFYTTSATERDRAVSEFGYRYEAIAGYVWSGL